MVGSVASSSGRSHGVDRFYNPPALRQRLLEQQRQQQQPSGPPPPQSRLQGRAKHKTRAEAERVAASEVESTLDSDVSSSRRSASASPSPPPGPPPPPPTGNLDRFLDSTTPLVPAHCLSKVLQKGVRSGRKGEMAKMYPYFSLGDLWESFKEWSSYGAGVPLVLCGGDSVIQYYVPYLSGIQLYVDSSRHRSRHRFTTEDMEIDLCREVSSGGSTEYGAMRQDERTCDMEVIQQVTERINGILLEQKSKSPVGGADAPSENNEGCNTSGFLVFEYLEREPPYGREPLADKISILANRFPELKTYNSCELLPTSWMSVAWYPIYRIPTGPTLRDLDACFLTFHSLSTLPKETCIHPKRTPWNIGDVYDTIYPMARLPLSCFGLASYKFRGSIWTATGLQEQQQASSLLQAAANWLQLLKVEHPDFRFFLSHNGTF